MWFPAKEIVYRIDKEIQLLNPSLLENIFLCLGGGFHVEKVLYPDVAVTYKSVKFEAYWLA